MKSRTRNRTPPANYDARTGARQYTWKRGRSRNGAGRRRAHAPAARPERAGARPALGASTADVLGLAIANALRVVAAGTLTGLILAAILSRLLLTMLFGVQPLDLVTFTSVVAVLAVTTALAKIGPAWRAARVDPAIALRAD